MEELMCMECGLIKIIPYSNPFVWHDKKLYCQECIKKICPGIYYTKGIKIGEK